jgi:hypothetical protein
MLIVATLCSSAESEATIIELQKELEAARKGKDIAVQAAKADKIMLEKYMIQQIKEKQTKGRPNRR